MRATLALFFAIFAISACDSTRDDRVEIRFWAMGREGEVVRELMPEFERRNPGIRVRVQQMPWTAAHEKMLTGFVGEATPDVSQLGNTWVPEFQMLGALEPLSPYVARSTVIDSTDYFRGIWLTNVVADTLFGAPWYVDTRLIYYRRDLLARVGVTSPPKSWSEWRSAMEKVRRAGAAKYGILLPTNEWAQLTTLAIQAGSPILRDGGRHGDFRSAEFGRAFEFYTSLFRDSLAPVASSSQIANLYQEFARGTFAMFVSGPWQIGELKQRMPPGMQDAWAAMPIPGPDATQYPGLSLAGGSSIVIWRESPHKQESWKLIEYLSEPEVQAKFAQLTGSLPARESAWTLAKLDTSANMAVFRDQLRRVAPTPMVPEWELIATRLFETSEQVVRGRMSETEARRSLDAEVDRILEKRRWLLDRQ